MKKSMSRILALLLTLMLLISAVPAAFAEEVIELGNKDSVEELLFEQVKAVFPSVDVEKQYVYAGYYENKNLSEKVDELLKTLTSDQLIKFTNFKAEHECTCYDENENLICGGADACACLCHKIDAFTAQMDALIAELQSLNIEEARAYIYALRFDEIIDWMVAQGLRSKNPPSPDVTIGSGGYEASLPEDEPVEDEPVAIAEIDEGETKSEGQQAADKYSQLQEKNGDESDIGTAIGEALKNYVNTESAFTSLYTQDADFASYVAAQSGENAGLLTAALNDDIMLLAEGQSGNFAVKSTPKTSENIKLKLFNYDASYLDNNSPLKFQQNVSLYGDAVDSNAANGITAAGGGSVNGGVSNTLGTDGYPVYTSGAITGSKSGKTLFGDGIAAHKATIYTNSGLFTYNTETGAYEYDSAKNAAWYDKSQNRFVLYNYPVCPPYTYQAGSTNKDDHHLPNSAISKIQAGNFLPFNKLIDGSTTKVSYAGKTKDNTDFYVMTEAPDLWFGMSLEFDFYMPENGVYMGEEMLFDFRGDDDVLVYIDDVLVLDISGTHAAMNGAIRFGNGNCFVSDRGTNKLVNLFKAAGKYDPTEWVTVNDYSWENGKRVPNGETTEIFKAYTKHTLKFFYLERGGNISYCNLKFNMPTLPTGNLVVEKQTNGNQTSATKDAEYTFKLEKKRTDGNIPVSGAEYTVMQNGSSVGESKKTKTDGTFTLKAGQKAYFAGLESQTYYMVSELEHSYTDSSKTQFRVTDEKNLSGKTQTSASAEVYVSPEKTSSATVLFTNTLKTTSLKVEKAAVNLRKEDEGKAFKFEASITGATTALTSVTDLNNKTYSITNGKFSFELKAGERITFTGLPIGANVEITEVDNGSFKISDFKTTVTATSVKDGKLKDYTYSGTLEGTDGSIISFTNELNRFPLTIKKEGLETIDENQSTLYRVTGNGVNLTVAIKGNDEITINDLLAGDYKVEELTDWSWRYNKKSVVSSDNETDGTVKVDSTDNWIKFTNDRTKDKWLDGDCYSENVFKAVGGGETEIVPDPSHSVGPDLG